jgi:hypothetical protein
MDKLATFATHRRYNFLTFLMSKLLVARVETRTFSFTLLDRKTDEVAIEMYNTPYVLVKKENVWQNHNSNKMEMSKELVSAVINAIEPEY